VPVLPRSLSAPDFDKLRAVGFQRALGAREAGRLPTACERAFESGAQPAERVFGALPVLAGDADRTVATAPIELLRFARQYLLEGGQRDALDSFGRELYEPRLRKLGWKEQAGENGDQRLLRADLVGFLASVLRDKATRASRPSSGGATSGSNRSTPRACRPICRGSR